MLLIDVLLFITAHKILHSAYKVKLTQHLQRPGDVQIMVDTGCKVSSRYFTFYCQD